MSRINSTRRANPFLKAFVLLFALLFMLFALSKFSTSKITEAFVTMFSSVRSQYTSRIEFTTAQKDSVRKVLSGYYTYTTDPSNPFGVDDRVEIKENGYVWQVTSYNVRGASGKMFPMMHVSNAFLIPFSVSDDDSTRVVCEVQVIRQSWIYDGDTCHGPSNYQEVWEMYGNGKYYRRNGRLYEPFLKDDLVRFFPEKLNLYIIDSMFIDSVLVPDCTPQFPLAQYLLTELYADFRNTPVAGRTADDILGLVRTYFYPLTITPIREVDPVAARINPFIATFFVDQAGIVTEAKVDVIGTSFNSHKIQKEVNNAILRWRFPPSSQQKGLLKVVYQDTVYKL